MSREPLHAPVHTKPLEKHELPNFDAMTDAEIEAFVSGQEGGNRYEVPKALIPDGMSYQWKSVSVVGMPNYSNQAECEQKGWSAVQQDRHDGRWMPHGTKGPIIVDGLMLMEIPTRLLDAKERYRNRAAREPIDGTAERLGYTAPNAAPRVDVSIKRTPFNGPVEFEVAP